LDQVDGQGRSGAQKWLTQYQVFEQANGDKHIALLVNNTNLDIRGMFEKEIRKAVIKSNGVLPDELSDIFKLTIKDTNKGLVVIVELDRDRCRWGVDQHLVDGSGFVPVGDLPKLVDCLDPSGLNPCLFNLGHSRTSTSHPSDFWGSISFLVTKFSSPGSPNVDRGLWKR